MTERPTVWSGDIGHVRRPRTVAACLVVAAAVACLVVPGSRVAATAAGAEDVRSVGIGMQVSSGANLAEGFHDPDDSIRPKTRWWWTCGDISRAEIDEEMRQIAQAGFGGVEILCFLSVSPVTQGWGSAIMQDRMEAALEAGERYGLDVDFTVGPGWPLVVPNVLPDSPEAAQELAQGTTVVTGGSRYVGPVPDPEPAPATGVTKKTLVAAQAVRCAASCKGDSTVQLDNHSSIDLTSDAEDGLINWVAPTGGDWLVFGFWQRGTGQAAVVGPTTASSTPAYVVDHFNRAGARAAVRYWDDKILTPAMRDLMRTAGGDLFEDSLELDSNMHWTWDFLDEFRKRRGYSLRPYLPVLLVENLHQQYSGASIDDPAKYGFGTSLDRRVRQDYYQTLTDLYGAEHVDPLQSFAHGLGLKYRAQTYGDTLDVDQLAGRLDIPETEGLVMDLGVSPLGRLNDYRSQAGSAHLSGKSIYSTECCAALNGAYGQSWEDLLGRFNAGFVGGVNQVVLHGFAYENGLFMGGWPGFSPFTIGTGNGFSEAFGPRQATWADTPQITEWLTRMQYLLRQGHPSVDVAVYRHNLDRHQEKGTGEHATLSEAGFTFEYVGPAALADDAATVRGKRLGEPAYRALVLDEQHAIPLATAKRLLSYARAGLPITIIGVPPTRTPGARDATEQDTELRAVIKQLLGQPTVSRISTEADLTDALDQLEVHPAVLPEHTTPLLSAHRATSDADIYVVHNPTEATVRTSLALEGQGTPYALDPWVGSVTSIAAYQRDAGRVSVPVTVRPGESLVLAVGALSRAPEVNVTSSTAQATYTADGLALSSTRPGDYRARLSNGKVVRAAISNVPEEQRLDAWHLDVESWERGADGKLAKTDHSVDLSALKPWSEIPGLEDVSGIGTYTTTVTVPSRWTGGRHAVLSLGEVTDTFRVRVNGRDVGNVDQITGTVDISEYLEAGENTISVRVATTLRNRLRVTPGFSGQASQPRQAYGLLGPVSVQPYGLRTVWPPSD